MVEPSGGDRSAAKIVRAAWSWFQWRYLTIDDRTLALVRIALGLLLLGDLLKRGLHLDVWYTDGGLMPRPLAHSHNYGSWSFFWSLGSVPEAAAGFAACAVSYVAFTLGLVTPLAHAASLVCLCSLHHRLQLLCNGGDYVMAITLWWTLLLPLGRRFSLDSRLFRRRVPSADGKTTSLLVLGLKLQLAGIYFFNAVHKSGTTWTEGTAVHYVLWLDRLATPFAVWLRGFLPPAGSELLTWGTRGIEGILPLVILSPIFKKWCHRAALFLVFVLHLGIASTMNVGLFSPAMMVLALSLVTTEDWHLLARKLPVLGADARSPTSTRGARAVGIVREAFAALLLWTLSTQLLSDNAAAVQRFGYRVSDQQAYIVRQLRFSQGWAMFSPDVGTGEMTLIVDAMTESGERVDPYNLVGARVAEPSARDIPEAIGYDTFWHSYTRLVPGMADLHHPLKRWIFAHHERTGRPEDRIILFFVFELTRANPKPGTVLPLGSAERIVFGAKR